MDDNKIQIKLPNPPPPSIKIKGPKVATRKKKGKDQKKENKTS